MKLDRLDLNLLVALDVLLTERNVTRAARSIGLSQSAMSSALGRLRTFFGDDILVKDGNAMFATARAEQLVEPVRLGLAIIRRDLIAR